MSFSKSVFHNHSAPDRQRFGTGNSPPNSKNFRGGEFRCGDDETAGARGDEEWAIRRNGVKPSSTRNHCCFSRLRDFSNATKCSDAQDPRKDLGAPAFVQ
jgi:hypothetical protein